MAIDDKAIDDNLMERMSADDLMRYIHNYLNHHSSVALGFATLLTEERYLELVNEKQKKIVLSLRNEIERIRELNEQMAQWLTHHHEDAP